MVEVAQSYEMVRNFNNFKAFVMFAVNMLMLVRESFFDYAYVSRENFLWPRPRRQNFREKFVRLGQNPRKCWSKHDDIPPPPPPPQC
jgi:hypothetical protein